MIEIFRTKLIRLFIKKLVKGKGKRKRKQKPWTIKETIIAIITVVIIFFMIFSMIFFMAKWSKNYREKQLANSFLTIGVIEKLKARTAKTRGREDQIFFFFIKNDTVFHKIYTAESGKIDKLKINESDCFELKVAKKDYDVFECYFHTRIDTLITKKQYNNHIYNNIFHKMKFK